MAFLLTTAARALAAWVVTPTGEEVFYFVALREWMERQGFFPDPNAPEPVDERNHVVEYYDEPILPA